MNKGKFGKNHTIIDFALLASDGGSPLCVKSCKPIWNFRFKTKIWFGL